MQQAEPKIADLLANMGIVISTGPISAWLTGAYPQIEEEKQAIVEAGWSSSAWQHIDDTGTRVEGKTSIARSSAIRYIRPVSLRPGKTA